MEGQLSWIRCGASRGQGDEEATPLGVQAATSRDNTSISVALTPPPCASPLPPIRSGCNRGGLFPVAGSCGWR